MNKKILKITTTSLMFLPFISCGCGNNSTIIIEKEIAEHDEKCWETTINDIANADCPTIYLTCDAAYYLMQAALIYYTSSELSLKNGNSNKLADQIMLISFKSFMYKTKESGSAQMYSYSYENLIGDAGGKRTHEYKDILQYGVEEGDHAVITNYEDFNDSDTYSSEADTDVNKYWLYTYDTTVKFLEKIYSMYDAYNPHQKFNFVIVDLALDSFVSTMVNESLNLQRTIYSRANKMYFLSDGTYSYATWRNVYANAFKQYGYTNCATQQKIWNNLHNVNIDDKTKNDLIKSNPIAFLNNEKYCSFLGNDGDFYRTCWGENNLCPSTMTKYAYSNIDFTSYKSIFSLNDTYNNELIYSILSFFDNNNAEQFINDQDNFIDLYATVDTKNHFDPNKKSIIIPTDSFITIEDNIRDKNITDIIDKMMEIFSQNNYNYVLKSHPRIDESIYDARMQQLFANYYDKMTILKPKYPLEELIVFDWYNQSKTSVNHFNLVDPLSYISNSPSGLIGGWSLLTTSIMSMLNLVANYETDQHLKIGNQNALKMIDTNCVFIPTKFSQSGGQTGDKLTENINNLLNMYQQFIILGKFIDINLLQAI